MKYISGNYDKCRCKKFCARIVMGNYDAAAVYKKYRENPETAYLGCSIGIIYRDPEDSYYDEAEFAIVKGNTVFGNLMDDVRFYGELALVREGIEKIHKALPDYKYVPM